MHRRVLAQAAWTVLVLIYSAFTLYTGIGLIEDLTAALNFNAAIARIGVLNIPVDLYAFVGALGFFYIFIRKSWPNKLRFTLGGICLAFMIGRFYGSFLVAGGSFIASGWLFLIVPPAYLILGTISLFLAFMSLSIVFVVVTGFPVLLFKQFKSIDDALVAYRYQTDGLGGYLGRFLRWINNTPLPDALPDESRGARFATHEEVGLAANYHKQGLFVGRYFRNELFLETNKHVLIMASTRSGKGVSVIIPHLLTTKSSAFVLDPKGENARITRRRRIELNSKVHVLDPFGITGFPQARFNPMARFTPETYNSDAKELAASLFVINETGGDHWQRSGQQLLALMIMFVYVNKDIPPEKKDLVTVRKNLLAQTIPILNTIVDWQDDALSPLAASFLETPEKERGSVISAAQRQTEILDDPYICACLAASGPGEMVDFRLWHTSTMTVYLCLAAPKFPTFNRWLRLLVTSALDEMTAVLNPPPLPVCFMLDETATIGRLAVLENAVSLSAGYGVQLFTVWQDVSQMRDIYKTRWQSFISNSAIKVLFNLDDFESSDYWSKSVGSVVMNSNTRKKDLYGRDTELSVGETMRPLIPSEQMSTRYAIDTVLVLFQGMHPIETDRMPYYMDPRFDGMFDKNTPLKPKQAKPQERSEFVLKTGTSFRAH